MLATILYVIMWYCIVTIVIGYVIGLFFLIGSKKEWLAFLIVPLLSPIYGVAFVGFFVKFLLYRIENIYLKKKEKMILEKAEESKFRVTAIERLRVDIDGNGVCTLVVLNQCPLKCKYCLNPNSRTNDFDSIYPSDLSSMLMEDSIYFEASGGGVTFGGGEPLLQSSQIKEFRKVCPPEWKINVETSLNVDLEHVQELADIVDKWYIDIKDMNPEIYKRYTKRSNRKVIKNLKWMVENGLADKMCIRIPLIPEFNTRKNLKESQDILEIMGLSEFDVFHYITKKKVVRNPPRLMGCPAPR